MSYIFRHALTTTEINNINDFKMEHPSKIYILVFETTGISDTIIIKDDNGNEKNITDYNSW